MKKWIEERFNTWWLIACVSWLIAFTVIIGLRIGEVLPAQIVTSFDAVYVPCVAVFVPMVMGFMAKK